MEDKFVPKSVLLSYIKSCFLGNVCKTVKYLGHIQLRLLKWCFWLKSSNIFKMKYSALWTMVDYILTIFNKFKSWISSVLKFITPMQQVGKSQNLVPGRLLLWLPRDKPKIHLDYIAFQVQYICLPLILAVASYYAVKSIQAPSHHVAEIETKVSFSRKNKSWVLKAI